MDLESYLGELGAAEPGRWTLDPARQREALARLGLPDPDLGFLKLAQAAVQNGAARMDWSGAGSEVRFSFSLSRPLPVPLWQQPDSALGLAILALSGPYEVSWRWHHGDQWRSGELFGRCSLDQETQPFAGDERLEVRVRQPGRGWLSSLSRRVHKLLAQRLAWAAVLVCWDGQMLNRCLAEDSDAFLGREREAYFFSEPGEPAGLWLPARSRARRAFYYCGSDQGEAALARATPVPLEGGRIPVRGWAALNWFGRSWSETVFVVDGVALPPERNLLDRPGVQAIVSSEGLNSALSGLDLVHDDQFRARLARLRPVAALLS